MTKFPTLYSISSTGKPLEWTIIAENDYFYTIAGQIGGQLVTSEPNFCFAKNVGKRNETSAEEQALAEAKAKWKKKLKTDYFEKLEDVTDASKEKYFEPMLAKVFWDRKDKVTYPCAIQYKYNGMRLILNKNGAWSRKGERVLTVPHFEETFKEFFESYPDAILDGEAYSHEYRHELNNLMKILRKTKNISQEDLDISREKVKYHIYDGFGWGGVSQKTNQFLRTLNLGDLEGYKYVEIVPSRMVYNEGEILEFLSESIEKEYEGAIVRLDGPYKNGRSSDLLKVKSEDDAEGIITKVIEGSGNWGGAAKTVTIKWRGHYGGDYESEFDASVVGTYEQGQNMLQNSEFWVGKEVTFVYFGLTGLGTPNYARIDINNCFKK